MQVCVPLPPWAVRAGARETIYHDPSTVNCAIVTCGGLCPGLNDVVQGLVRKLEDYGVPDGNILGIRSASKGFLLWSWTRLDLHCCITASGTRPTCCRQTAHV